MSAEADLVTLVRNLRPEIRPGTYVFCSLPGADHGALAHASPLVCVAEPEGLSVVLTQESADREGLAYGGTFRCISLLVHSSLEAVGLTAAVAGELADHGISANVVAGYHHDHVFVPSCRADEALGLLESMSARA